jgi:hypothetical protein
MSMDFEQSMNIRVSPGAPGTFNPDEPCQCRYDRLRGTKNI